MTIQFETGKTYITRIVADAPVNAGYTVSGRTAKTVIMAGKVYRPVVIDGVEKVFPDGRFSMAPVLSADRWQAA